MAKPVSKREQDLQRRKGGPNRKLYYGVGAVAIVGLFIVLAVQEDAAAGGLEAFELDDDPFLGNPDANVVLIGYESPHCSACRGFHTQVLPELQTYLENGSLVYHYIQGTIGGDKTSNIAQECAYREGGNTAFWSLTDRLYSRQGNTIYGTPDWNGWLRDLAGQQGLDEQKLLKCHEDESTNKNVLEDLRVGRDHGARGTPTFWLFVDGKEIKVTNFNQLPSEIAALV